MKILSINCGSSSLKFQAYEMPEEKILIKGRFERIGIDGSFYTIWMNYGNDKVKNTIKIDLPDHETAFEIVTRELINYGVIKDLSEIDAIGHRVVHGGDKYSNSVIIDDDVIKTVEELSDLAPLHNPANIMGIKASMKAFPKAKQVACFDTAFHQTMKEDKYIYAVPYSWYEKYGIRKYGFHGMSHKYVSNRAMELLDKEFANVIVCHLGQGGSISAVRDGKCIDTTMGFTPNSGTIMGSRSGDIDYGIIPYIMKKENLTLEEVDNKLNKESGILGISGISSDFRDIDAAIAKKDRGAILAHYAYVNSIVKYVSEYYVELGGVDAICFTAGVGENAPHIRRMVMDRLSCLGIKCDREANDKIRGEEGIISTSDSSVKCFVIPTDEELMIARDSYDLVK